VSVANLALIAVMVVIFAAASLLPFPHRRGEDFAATKQVSTDGDTAPSPQADGATSDILDERIMTSL
jgi:hypothetical protein